MLYENYQQKVQKILEFFKTIKRHRVKILAITAVFFAMLFGMLFAKGIVFSDNNVDNQLVYGESHGDFAKAFFSKVSYEYAERGSLIWSDEMPTDVGEYRVRAVGRRTFGSSNYGKEHTFQILPKSIDVTLVADTIVYGENPLLSADLAYNDKIECNSFNYEDITKTSTKVLANINSIVIINKDGKNVSGSYSINVIESDITFKKRPITIKIADATAVYSDTPLNAKSYDLTEGSLAFNDTIVAQFDSEITNVGKAVNTAQISIINENGIDLVRHYNINKINGVLTVEKRLLTIETIGAEKIYDGNALSSSGYNLSMDTPLVSGHKLILTSAASLTNVGSCANALIFQITNGSMDVTSNYSLVISDSILTVHTRTISIRTFGANKVYDGNPLTNDTYTVESSTQPINGHILHFSFTGEQTRVGSSENILTISKVTEGDKNITANYSFIYNYGILEVTKRNISVRTLSMEFIYNGKEQSYDEIEITSSLKLVEEERIVPVASTRVILKNVTPNAVKNDFSIRVLNRNSVDVTDCYGITYQSYGTVKMLPLYITVTTATADFYYTGSNQSNTTITSEPSVAEGQFPRVKGQPTMLNKVEPIAGGGYKEYKNIFEIEVFSGNDNVTSNYVISYVYGTLKMLPRLVTVTTSSKEFIYNGSSQSDNSYRIEPVLVLGHTATLVGSSTTLTEVEFIDGKYKEYENRLELAIFDGIEDVSYNYTIDYIYGTLVMKPRPITVVTGTNSWIYDGYVHFDDRFTITNGSLVAGQTASVQADTLTKITDVIRQSNGTVGNEKNVFVLDIFGSSGKVTHNYDITYVYGSLTIQPLRIIVTTNSNSWEYDGMPHFELGHQITFSELLVGHTTFVSDHTSILNVIKLPNNIIGSLDNKLTIGVNADGVEKTHNYDISYIFGKLSLQPRKITVMTGSASWVYNGLPQYNKDHTIIQGSLALGQESIAAANYTTMINVKRGQDGSFDTIENKFSIEIFSYAVESLKTNCTPNYDISYIYGTLQITPRSITVRPAYTEKSYDGLPLYCTSVEIISTLDIVEGQYVIASFAGSQTIVGSNESSISSLAIFSVLTDVTYNYDVTLQKGILVVRLRYLYITAESAEKFYDGTALTANSYRIEGDGLMNGHKISAEVEGSQTEVGRSGNYIIESSVKLTDLLNNDVSQYYKVIFYSGELHVYLVEITLKTFSKEKPYDGTPLTYDRYEIIGSLIDGHEADVYVYGWIISVGEIQNGARIRVIYDDKDVTNSYKITNDFGVLTVYGNATDLGGLINQNSDGESGSDEILFSVYSNISTAVYLRIRSFGNYITSGWENASPYLQGDINALYLTHLALSAGGKNTNFLTVRPISNYLSYMMPYYARNGYITKDDTMINYSYSSEYSFDFISYSYNPYDSLPVNSSGYGAFEQAYYQFVLQNYLQLPSSTRSKLLEIAAQNNFNASNPSIISDVASFVQNKVKYSFNYSYKGDIAVYFFTEAQTGICQHYATAATAMFRALGIPARYVVGFAANTLAGSEVEVSSKQAHAWVEVYLQGVGWVQIEVTGQGDGSGAGGGSGGGNGGGGGGDSMNIPMPLSIKPIDVRKIYDGTPLYSVNIIEGNDLDSMLLLDKLLKDGYRYTVTVVGSRIDYGVSDSYIESFVLYDAYNRNVTEQFNVMFNTGRVRILHFNIITLHIYALQKYYDSTPLSYESTDYWIESGLPSGYTLDYSMSGSLTDTGIMKLSYFEDLPYKVFDHNDNDVSDQFSLVFVGNPLRVDRRNIEITSASSTKVYDGKKLTNSRTWISKGSLAPLHSYVAEVIGEIVDIGTDRNTISAITILDSKNVDVSNNYNIIAVSGVLIIKSEY